MTKRVVSYLGCVFAILGAAMFIPALIGIYYGESAWDRYVYLGLVGVVIGILQYKRLEEKGTATPREGYMLVGFTWLLAGVYGAMPFIIQGATSRFGVGFFEACSGFTTTGATAFGDIDALPKSLIMWRSICHWLGGMGVASVFVAISGALGSGGFQLIKAETTGPVKDKVVPKIKETTKILWFVYMAITVIIIIVLLLLKMPLFDSVCNAFATVSTGGFNCSTAGLAKYNSPAIEWAIGFFMAISGVNFALYYTSFKKRSIKPFKGNSEFNYYWIILFGMSILTSLALRNTIPNFTNRIRHSFFQISSMMTTTGFSSTDFDLWPATASFLVILAPFIGGSAGSTAGGIKVGRVVILWNNMKAQLKRLIHPRAIIPVRCDGRVVPNEVVSNVSTFFFLYIGLFTISCFIFAISGLDYTSAITAAASCINNAGPGLGLVGPTQNFGFLPDWLLIYGGVLMLVGRLEIYTILLMFTKDYWIEI